ncbi:uncharacterized protein LOC128551553 [Mercenaria mercenaria]|uniref:uncharacterized protein LOC128551553 n=1 Tax=Mercenaria mercenaria TaxID=6596 RepID=UPI00234F45D6|nr:uncharacterized protein LOC128551553 [Mercenaria mercenaria]
MPPKRRMSASGKGAKRARAVEPQKITPQTSNMSVSDGQGSAALVNPAGATIRSFPAEPASIKRTILFKMGYTPLNTVTIIQALNTYPQSTAAELIEGLTKGFPLHHSGPRQPRDSPNLASSKKDPAMVYEKIQKEIDKGRIGGPFRVKPFPNLQTSPTGLVPKKDGDYRMIHHLSYPENKSINTFIDGNLCTVSYSTIDEAAQMIFNLGQGSFLSKTDIQSAFRLFPVSPADFELLGFKFPESQDSDQFLYFYDKVLPFGSSISCATWEKFACFLHWSVHKKSKNKSILHYLDDFLFGESSMGQTPGLQLFQDICKIFGVPLSAEKKTVFPTTCLVFLGVEFDTIQMIMRLPQDKLARLKNEIIKLSQRKKVTLREMQSLLGLLNFACRVIAPGRAFCRRLINSTIGLKKTYHKTRVTQYMKADLSLWLQFLDQYNGVTVISDSLWVSTKSLHLYTDSAGGPKAGFGIYFAGHWAQGNWPESFFTSGLTRDMTFLELFPVVAAIMTWAVHLQNRRVLFSVDNQAVVQVINTQTCRSEKVMNPVRHMVLTALKHNMSIKTQYIPSKSNTIADSLSRSQWSKFRTTAPEADLCPTKIPPQVWHM